MGDVQDSSQDTFWEVSKDSSRISWPLVPSNTVIQSYNTMLSSAPMCMGSEILVGCRLLNFLQLGTTKGLYKDTTSVASDTNFKGHWVTGLPREMCS